MGSLREIKDRISSVRSTLKITGAMKLVASAKLRKAQQAMEAVRPYREELSRVFAEARAVIPSTAARRPGASFLPFAAAPRSGENAADGAAKNSDAKPADGSVAKLAVVALSSNSSLCGAFNSNVIKKALAVIGELGGNVDIFALGKKMADRLRKYDYPSVGDFNNLVAAPTYEAASELADRLIDAYESGTYSKVILIYNHFVSCSRQQVEVETYLPFALPERDGVSDGDGTFEPFGPEYIMEPSAKEIAATLLPQLMRLKFFSVLLDSVTAEHAARTIAMQAATDNAEDLLADLTLEYNKGRQGRITSEILDLAGGQQQ